MSHNFEKSMRKIAKRIKERKIINADKSKNTSKEGRKENI